MIVHVYSLSNTNQITFTNKLLHFTIVDIYKSRSLRPSDWGTELRSPKWARLLEVFGTVRRVRFFRSIRAVRDVRCSLNKCFSLTWSPLDRSEHFEYPNSEQSLFRVRWTLFVGLVWSGTKYIASLFHPHGPRIPADRVIETIKPFERKKSPKLAIFHLVNLGMIYCLN